MDENRTELESELLTLIASHRAQLKSCEAKIAALQQQLENESDPAHREILERNIARYQVWQRRCEIFLKALQRPDLTEG